MNFDFRHVHIFQKIVNIHAGEGRSWEMFGTELGFFSKIHFCMRCFTGATAIGSVHISQGTRTGVPLTYVYPLYLLCSTLGFLGIIIHKYPRNIGLT